MELRITTGSAKNKKLIIPDIPGFRAVQEIAKSSMFSIIGDNVEGSVCLDLFAGSGNLGIEALSRGAAWCDFVDGNKESVEAIRKNVENCNFFEKSSVTLKNAVKYVAGTETKYDFIFMDPFYNDMSHTHLFKNLGNSLKDGGVIFYFHEDGVDIAQILEKTPFEVVDSRKFGVSVYDVIKRKRGY